MLIRLTLMFLALSAFTPRTPINLINEDGQPSPALLKLFNILGFDNDGSASHLNQIAQKNFLRNPSQERWEMGELFQDKHKELYPIFEDLGVISEIQPAAKIYDCIVIHGATVNTMRQRLKFLDNLWFNGVWARKIVFLTGERPLDPTKENTNVLFDQTFSMIPFWKEWSRPTTIPQTESEAASMLWDQIITHPDLRSRKPCMIAAPMIKNIETGALSRPTTVHAIRAWLESGSFLPDGRCLAISNNPYIPYQDQTLRCLLQQKGMLNSEITLETVGPAADKDISVAIHLDNIARWLYTEINTCKRAATLTTEGM